MPEDDERTEHTEATVARAKADVVFDHFEDAVEAVASIIAEAAGLGPDEHPGLGPKDHFTLQLPDGRSITVRQPAVNEVSLTYQVPIDTIIERAKHAVHRHSEASGAGPVREGQRLGHAEDNGGAELPTDGGAEQLRGDDGPDVRGHQ